jgi:Reverse transcriptase (RNA-dependent DNA polymerase)
MLKTDEGAIYILVYVDDLIILAPTDELLSSVLKSLHRQYELRQMDDVTMFLGVKLTWTLASDDTLSSVSLSQPRYITNVLRRFGMSEQTCGDPDGGTVLHRLRCGRGQSSC